MLLSLLLLILLLPYVPGQRATKKRTKLSCDFQRPTFNSQNLKNNLTWTAVKKSEGVKYSVTYLRYGTKIWNKIPECTNVTRTWCDLTKETSDYKQEYFGNVTVIGSYCFNHTKKFSPRLHTEIGPPTVKLFHSETFIEIKLTHPINNSNENLKYHIYLNGKHIEETENPYYKKEHLHQNTTYCVTAEVEWYLRKGIPSNKTCVTTNADPISQRTFTVMVCVVTVILVILLVIASGYIIHKSISVKDIIQPHILNIKASNNKNVISVEANTVTINLITIDGNLNLQHTVMTDEEESKNPSDLHPTDSDNHIGWDSIINEADEGSDDDHGYKSLQEEITPSCPTISPYDMPHYLHKQVRSLDTSSDIVDEGDLYGRIKYSSIHNNSIQEKEENIVQNRCKSENSLDKNTYLPQGHSNFAVQGKIKEELFVVEEFCTDDNSDIGINVMTDKDLNECSMLFVDWSPDNPHSYIPNLSKNKELERCVQQCQEEKETLLNQLYPPIKVTEMSEDDELGLLEKRWGLLLQGTDK